MTAVRFSLPRAQPVLDDEGRRHCNQCGDFIDPIDWCIECQRVQAPCGVHRRLRKRSDAAFCDSGCRSFKRSTYARDCLPFGGAS